jgi:hypothetical protein
MSIFGDILNKITTAVTGTGTSEAAAGVPASPPTTEASATTPTETNRPAISALSEVDVENLLNNMASQRGGESHWRTSIVDLLRLLDLPFDLDARHQLANELDVHVGADGTAEQNMALHRAVMHKLEENGGKVPDSLKG